jgi:hypothetical protein
MELFRWCKHMPITLVISERLEASNAAVPIRAVVAS